MSSKQGDVQVPVTLVVLALGCLVIGMGVAGAGVLWCGLPMGFIIDMMSC